MSKDALLIFARNPEIGKVKTRLAVTLGNEKALAVYMQLLQTTASATRDLPIYKCVYYSLHPQQGDAWDDHVYHKQVQHGKDLGDRMKNAFSDAFEQGFKRVVIIGTDCPDLNASIITDAFACLDDHDLVIGPAEDGGYYLLGTKRFFPELFLDINWSTSTVLEDTLRKSTKLQLKHYLLPVLVDIDEAEDLKAIKKA